MLELRLRLIRLRNFLFGPPYTSDDVAFLRVQANAEEWTDVLAMIQDMPRKQRRWWVNHLLTGKAQVITVPVYSDPYHDDDPYEME